MKPFANLSDLSLIELADFKKLELEADDKDASGNFVRVPKVPLNRQIVVRVEYGDTEAETEIFTCESLEDMRHIKHTQQSLKSPATIEWFTCSRKVS